MNKHCLSLLALATVLCMMLFSASSCKKDDPNGGETPDSTEADFFIDVNFLPKEETNGELAPRLMINFNDEAVMIELRQPSADTAAMESVLFLCPDNEAMLMCGNDRLLVCAAYDVETYTPSDDVLLVTPLNDDALLLTKCVMDWNTNSMTKGDMMVLPIDETSKNLRKRGDDADETRDFVFNHLVKRFGENFDKAGYFCDVMGIPLAPVFSAYNYTITTGLTNILYSDDSEELYDHTSYPVSMWTAQGAQTVIINHLPLGIRDVVSSGVALFSWYMSGGHGKVDDYEGGNGGTNEFSYPSIWSQSGNVIHASDILNVQPPAYILNLDVSNITENSAYFKGHLQFTSSITPIAMGYVFKLSGGPEHIVEDMSFQGKTVSGLIKATKYIAYAYAESAGDRVVSPEVSFWTLGFEAFPNSLTFPAEGDTKYFGLSYSHEDITSWEITSQPSWCSITTDDLGLLVVTVGASIETRSGTITITAHSNALGTLTENVMVTQYGSTPSGYFTGTPFDNTSWNVPVTYVSTTTGIRRVGDWHSNPNGIGGYYTYHNENFSETDSQNSVALPSFKMNTLFQIKSEGYENSYEFKGDSIIWKVIMGDEGGVAGFVNGETSIYESVFLGWNIHEEYTLSRCFTNSNTFCFRFIEDYTGGESFGGDDDWYRYRTVYDYLMTYTINESTHTCVVDYSETITMNALEYGSEYTGRLSENTTRTVHGTGTYEYGGKGNNVTQGDNSSDFLFGPMFPVKRHH